MPSGEDIKHTPVKQLNVFGYRKACFVLMDQREISMRTFTIKFIVTLKVAVRASRKRDCMENKTTIELIELFETLTDKDYAGGGLYEQIIEEIKTREPFIGLYDKDYEDSLPNVWKLLNELQEDVKRLKRHKHDTNSGDVLVRI